MTGLAIADASELLSDIGYLLVPGSPFGWGPTYLLVAIRPKPTRAHFDPERIEFWTAGPELAEPATLEWPMADAPTDFSWGTIKVIDRIGATNHFVSFGGSLTVSHDGALSAALFRSDAPILAVSGRGDAGDPLATSVAGFFARLRAACGADPELARRATRAGTIAVYAAYVARTLDLYKSHLAATSLSPRLHALLRYEHSRLGRDSAAAVAAAENLDRALARL